MAMLLRGNVELAIQFSLVLTTSGVASGIFMSFEADFLLAVIAASLFLSPSWGGMLHYLVIRYRIHDPVALPSNAAEREQQKKGRPKTLGDPPVFSP